MGQGFFVEQVRSKIALCLTQCISSLWKTCFVGFFSFPLSFVALMPGRRRSAGAASGGLQAFPICYCGHGADGAYEALICSLCWEKLYLSSTTGLS